MVAPDPDRYPELSLEAFLDHVAAKSPAPGGGSVAAVATALAAGLCSMAARKSPTLEGAAAAAASADGRRQQALALASKDALAYGRVIEAQRAVGAVQSAEPAVEPSFLTAALSAAADVPLELAGVAAETSALARDLVAGGNANLVGDSLTGALLAAAGAEAAAALVAINLAGMPGAPDDRAGRAAAFAAAAGSAAREARAAASERFRGP